MGHINMPPKKKDDKKKGATGNSKQNLKDFLAKSKGGAAAKKKKWSKGKVRENLNNLVVFDQGTYDRMMKEVATFKLVTPSAISERLKVNDPRSIPLKGRWRSTDGDVGGRRGSVEKSPRPSASRETRAGALIKPAEIDWNRTQ